MKSKGTEPLISPTHVPTLRELDFDLRLVDEIGEVFSFFDARQLTPDEDGYFPPLVPADNSGLAEFQNADRVAREHPFLKKIILSDDGKLAIWTLSQGRADLPVDELMPVYQVLQEIAANYSEKNIDLHVEITGLAAIRCETISLLFRENLIFHPLVALAGILACFVLFRNPTAVLIAVTAPLAGMLCSIGLMGWVGESMNVINNILPPLILVIGFSDGVHLVFHFKRLRATNLDRTSAAWRSLVEIGPACLLTSLTTGIALLSLIFTEAAILQRFGVTAAITSVIMFVAVIVITPLLAASPLGDKIGTIPPDDPKRNLWDRLTKTVLTWPGIVSLLGVVALGISLHRASQLDVDFRVGEYLPSANRAVTALEEINESLSGTSVIMLMVEWENETSSKLADWVPILTQLEKILRSEPVLGPPFSAKTLLASFDLPGLTTNEKIAELKELLPPEAFQVLFQDDGNVTLLASSLPVLGAKDLNPIIERIRSQIAPLETQYPGLRIHLTGIPILTAQTSDRMISELATSLFFAGVIIFILIGILLRSPLLGIATLLPNLLPLAAVAGLLHIVGLPLQYHSVLMFTICLGIAVDDSIHLLFRYRHHRRCEQQNGVDESLQKAVAEVGPTLVTTSCILIAGIGVLLFSHIPVSRIFGGLSCLAILFALIADVVFLPAAICFGHRIRKKYKAQEKRQPRS